MKEAEITPLETSIAPIRITGKIIKVDTNIGYVFINSPSKKFTRIFGHWQAFDHRIEFEKLEIGQEVSFELKHDVEKGFRAINIELV